MERYRPTDVHLYPLLKGSSPVRPGLRWAALLFAMGFPTLMAWVYFDWLAVPAAGARPSWLAGLVYGASKLVQFSFPVAWVGAFERQRLRLAAPTFRGLGLGVAFGLMVAAAVLTIYYGGLRGHRFLAGTPEKVLAKLQQFQVTTPLRYALLTVFLAGFHALLEEYYWRWFVFGELRRAWSLGPALILSSLAFMAHHVIILAAFFPGRFLTAALPCSLGVAVGGGVWAWLYQRSGSLYAPWISHLIIDAAIMAVGYDLAFGHRTGAGGPI